MLKTKNNIYLIYENMSGDKLQTILAQTPPFQKKISIAAQTILALEALQSANILHLAIDLTNIVIMKDYHVKLINLTQAIRLNPETEENEKPVLKKIFIHTSYSAPQLSKGTIHRKSDIYSCGMVFYMLFDQELQALDNPVDKPYEVKKYFTNKQQLLVTKLKQICQRMTLKNPENRPSIDEIKAILMENKAPLSFQTKKRQFLSATSKQYVASPSSDLSKKSDQTVKKQPTNQKSESPTKQDTIRLQKVKFNNNEQRANEIFTYIIKKRNFSLWLLTIGSSVLKNKINTIQSSLILAFLLAKKSTICVSQLLKLIKIGNNDSFNIQVKVRQMLAKQAQFNKFSSLIGQEMLASKKKLNHFVQILSSRKDNNGLLSKEMQQQKLSEAYLKEISHEYVNEFLSTLQFQNPFESSKLFSIYCLALLAEFNTFQNIFEIFFENCAKTIEEGYFYQKFISLPVNQVYKIFQNLKLAFNLCSQH